LTKHTGYVASPGVDARTVDESAYGRTDFPSYVLL
jgi:hypothetical protein